MNELIFKYLKIFFVIESHFYSLNSEKCRRNAIDQGAKDGGHGSDMTGGAVLQKRKLSVGS